MLPAFFYEFVKSILNYWSAFLPVISFHLLPSCFFKSSTFLEASSVFAVKAVRAEV